MLVFAPHPDDAELGAGGIIALHTELGYRVGICDLTEGEMGTNGTPELRRREADHAKDILKAQWRENLQLPDSFVSVTEAAKTQVVELIRTCRPQVLLVTYPGDDHPDHNHAAELVREAAYLAGLEKYPARGERHRPDRLFYYFLGRPQNPDLVVDITEVHDTKIKSVLAHKSQLGLNETDHQQDTRLTHPSFLDRVIARDRYMGSLTNCEFGEGLMCERVPRVHNLFQLGG